MVSERLGTFVSRIVGSPAFKLAIIATLLLLLAIPLLMVWGLISEREHRAREVRSEVASEWGASQTIIGPVLIVPYTAVRVTTQAEKRVEEVVERHAIFLPDTLDVRGKAESKLLHRAIYDLTVYSAKLDFEGRFAAPNFADVAAEVRSIRWRDATLAIAISDVSGLQSAAEILINGETKLGFEPSLGLPGSAPSGIHVKLIGSAKANTNDAASSEWRLDPFSFKFTLALNGSSELHLAPVARTTTLQLNADWPHPSFGGGFLPVERTVSDAGFAARWQVPHLARSVPQAWSANELGIERLTPFAFGVRFYVPVDFYDLVSRALKYGLMFLATAFMAVFLLDMGKSRQVHGVQYLFVGLAMVFFYVLLLSLAEHIGFGPAYLIASAATGGMLSVYVARAQASARSGLIMLALFGLLYGLLFLILRLEDYALLAGAACGFVLLTVMMFRTLGIDWSGRSTVAERT